MSDVNKLDNKQCPFDPDQYKKKIEIDDIAQLKQRRFIVNII